MKDLIELVSILSRTPKFKPKIFRGKPGWTPDLEDFYQGLASGHFDSDAIAFTEFFQGDDANKNKYRLLKSRLRIRLLNSLHLLEIHPPAFSEPTEAFYRTHQLLFLSSIVERFSGGRLKTDLALEGLEIAERFEFTVPAIAFLSILCRATSFGGQKKRYKFYDQKLRQANRLHVAETLVASLYQHLAIQFARTTSDRPELVSVAIRSEAKANRLASKASSYSLMFYTFRIRLLSAQIGREYERGLQICDDAIAYLNSRSEFALPVRLGEFHTYKLLCYLHLREYEKGKREASQCEKLFRHGSLPWFIYREYFFLLAMHTSQYEDAKQIFDETVHHEGYILIPEDRKERWKIYELYLNYILRHIQSAQYKPNRGPKTLSLQKLLQEIPTYSKDKNGFNISILIIHILYLLEQKDFDGITLRMDALKSYRLRYLQPKTKRQSAIFFKLLLIMERESFDYENTVKYTEHYFSKLQQTPSDYSEYEEALQILPFDWLWPHILGALKRVQITATAWKEKDQMSSVPARRAS